MYQICDTSQSLDNHYYQMDLLMDATSLPKATNPHLKTENIKKKSDQPIINEFHALMNQHKIQENPSSEFNSDFHNNNQKKNTGKYFFNK